MEKVISATQMRRNFGKVLHNIGARGDRVIVERYGEPVAAIVPVELYAQWKRGRSHLFEQLRSAQEHAGLSPQEADALAAQAVQAVRRP